MPVEAALGLLVHRGCRFIEEDPAGTLRENARKSELLLLTQREDMAPVAFAVQQRDQVGKSGERKERFPLLPRKPDIRIRSGFGERSHRHVGLLRDEHGLLFGRQDHLALRIGPETGEYTKERRFPRAGWPLDDDLLPRMNDRIQMTAEHPSSGDSDLHIRETELLPLSPLCLSRALRLFSDGRHVCIKANEPVHAGLPLRQRAVHVDEVGHRLLHLAEAVRHLHEAA